MKPTRIDVVAGARTYQILIGSGLTSRLDALVRGAVPTERRFIVSNPTVWRIHGPAIAAALPDIEPILIPDGERFKTVQTVGKIYESLMRAGADR